MSNLSIEQQTRQEDEIDLFQLFETLWHGKLLITFICIIFIAVGAGYAFQSTPVYESRAYLLPPTEKGIIELSKAQLLGTTVPTKESVYQIFLQQLNSNNAKHQFFETADVNTYFMQRSVNQLQAWKTFNAALTVNLPTAGELSKTDISFKTDAPELSARWTNAYVDFAISLTRQQITEDLQEKINAHLNQIELRISNRYQLYQSEIDAELAKLREALNVAESVKQEEPLKTDSIIEQQNTLMVDEIRRLYHSGSNALKAEITAIEQRRDNKALISGLAHLLQQKALITSLTINPEKIVPAQIDLAAQIDNNPIASKKALILTLAMILGLITGVMLVLIRSAIQNRKDA